MDQVDALLRELADDPADYERQGGSVLLTRQGRTFSLSLRETPAVGIVVEGESDAGKIASAPLNKFVQQGLLDLPRLAAQIAKSIDKSSGTRPAKYVDGPAKLSAGGQEVTWNKTAEEFTAYLNEQELGTTRLIQLMAGAGQGKTVLLEQIARDSAAAYVPDVYPKPFLLTVDLLGRYVGTVDDAIAGSLNNTYMFPGLTQRDVTLCVRNRWIILALDGFDELVARVGSRDAFQRVTELLDQLRAAGTVILSAREAFFELYQISAAIRSYLQPKVGSYTTSTVSLLAWTDKQGLNVFRSLGSEHPEKDLQDLVGAFGNDREIVLHPFFLTRLASLWRRGERFTDAQEQKDPRWRTEYIIRTYIDRETNLKWTTRDGAPLLGIAGHTAMLAGLAEEMWRSGAFRLTDEEVRLSTEMSLTPLSLPPAVVEGVVERAPTHAALVPRERGYGFVHERFFQYYLAVRLRDVLLSAQHDAVTNYLQPRELSPDSVSWLDWLLREGDDFRPRALATAVSLAKTPSLSSVVRSNLALLLGVLLADHKESTELRGMVFVGEALRGHTYCAVAFLKCEFWQLDVSGTIFDHCRFVDCRFGEMLLDAKTRFSNSLISGGGVQAIERQDGTTLYEPDQIFTVLEERGARVERTLQRPLHPQPAAFIDPEATQAVAKMVRRSQRASDLPTEDIEGMFSEGRKLLRIGLESGVLKDHPKRTSGPRKSFVRFQVDRQLLLRGQSEPTGDARIDDFWAALVKHLPR